MRYSIAQTFFMPFTNTGLAIVIGRALMTQVRTLDQERSDNGSLLCEYFVVPHRALANSLVAIECGSHS
jgi:hypothetical protein